MFKIRRRKDGQFSVGGLYPTWGEVGVRWATLHQVRTHVIEAYKRNPEVYKDADVVEIEEIVKRVVSPYEVVPIDWLGKK